jgi:two-component system, OmpR family, phosphate regulon sensor histidine kinase PhoR
MRLLWRIYICFFLSTMLALAVTAWYANHSLQIFYKEQVASELLTRANILARELDTSSLSQDALQVDRRCKEFGRLTQTRVTVILSDGRVIGDSDHDPATMENHSNRPEIAEALKGRIGNSERFSDTIRRTLMYLAIPVWKDGVIIAVARTSLPLSVIDWTLHSAYRHIAMGAAMVAVFFAVIAYYFARRISHPLADMRLAAERLAQGDLKARVALPKGEEMQSLARTLNQMAAQLSDRMETITRKNDEQKAVFSSMVEGVLAVDGDTRILDLNSAAARLLELTPEQVRGRSIQEAVRNLDLQKFIAETLSVASPAEAEIILYGNEERFLQLHGTSLTDATGKKFGALIVLNDITRLKRLETVRRDFVANVSHELKTPITALKGCVETLSDPTHRTPEDDERFMAMMGRQVERLSAIVEDLLSLSRIEHDAEHKRIPLEPGSICDVLRRSAQVFAKAADAKGIHVAVECPGDLAAPINSPLLEQAVGNLIDNAIKYSGERTNVLVSGMLNGRDIEIRVTDEGPGIEKKHLSRIFERFYRVDSARSRALGGTGLGLAIVRHIVLAHGGQVSVESTPGQGSTFIIRIPQC